MQLFKYFFHLSNIGLLDTLQTMWVYLNDQFVSEDNAKVSICDLGFMRSFGIFEFARVYDGKVFRLSDHLSRFFASAESLGLNSPFTSLEIKELCLQLVEKNKMVNMGIKIVLSAGLGDFGPGAKPTFAILPASLRPPSQSLKVMTHIYERFLPSCKTLNYLPAILARQKMISLGFDEPLFLDCNRNVLEGARENFFAVKGEKLITAEEGVLSGVTRAVVLEMADVEMRTLPYDELKECDGAFFTSTVREIAPITQIDDLYFDVPQVICDLQRLFKDKACSMEPLETPFTLPQFL